MTQIDRDFLVRHSSHTTDGITERALRIAVDGEYCFALLTAPSSLNATGFVVCHSYGIEFLTYRRVERAVARSLAVMGYPVLAIHCRGYGDSTGSLARATLQAHLEDIDAGFDALSKETGTSSAGLIGAGFGGLIAGLAARSRAVERLLLMNPALSGGSYFRGMFREMRMVQVANGDGAGTDPLDALRREEMIDVLGYPVYRHLFEALAGEDLSTNVGTFAGRVLAVHVAKRQSFPRSWHAFRTQVEANGGSCDIEHVAEPPGAVFGGPAFVSGSDPTVRVDGQEPIARRIGELVREWMA